MTNLQAVAIGPTLPAIVRTATHAPQAARRRSEDSIAGRAIDAEMRAKHADGQAAHTTRDTAPALLHGAPYRVLTTAGRVLDRCWWDGERMLFRLGNVVRSWDRETLRKRFDAPTPRKDGTVPALSLNAVEAIAARSNQQACGGERFVPVGDWFVGECAA